MCMRHINPPEKYRGMIYLRLLRVIYLYLLGGEEKILNTTLFNSSSNHLAHLSMSSSSTSSVSIINVDDINDDSCKICLTLI